MTREATSEDQVLIRWNEYHRKICAQIAQKKNAILLNAEDIDGPGGKPRVPGAVFQLTSRIYQKEFITLWKLFENREIFDEFINMLVEKVKEVRHSTGFTAILTCTLTAKHLSDHIQPRIETAEHKIAAHYLGSFPFVHAENSRSLDFTDERVLILTDVVASGSLVKNLARVIEQQGGTVVGVVAGIVTGQEVKDELTKHSDINYNLTYRANAEPLRIDCLATYELTQLPEGKIPNDPNKIYPIDPVTVLPDISDRANRQSKPLIPYQDMEKHFQETNAVDIDFYQAFEQRYMVAVRLGVLLKHPIADSIWAKIAHLFEKPNSVIVTTYDRDDMFLRDFVLDHLDESQIKSIRCIMLPRRDVTDGSDRYFLFEPDVKRIKKRGHIILLISSAHTSEKLRELISLLAMTTSVRTITVLCLLNRMGTKTINFVTRISRLLSGISETDTTIPARFQFLAVYNLSDFSRHRIMNMHQTIATLLTAFSTETRTSSLSSLIEQEYEDFRPRSTTTFEFQNPPAEQGPSLKLFPVCSQVSTTKNYDGVVELLRTEEDKRTLYKLFAIILSDLRYIKASRQFDSIWETILGRIRQLRDDRFYYEAIAVLDEDAADSQSADGASHHQRSERLLQYHIEDNVETESYCLFGLSLLSYLDQEHDYGEIIEEILLGGKTLTEWAESPRNLIAYFGSPRWALTVSMLIFFSGYHKSVSDTESRRDKTITTLISMKDYFNTKEFRERIPPPIAGEIDSKMNRVVIHFNLLLGEAGAWDVQDKHQVIRYLNRYITDPNLRHNHILKSLTEFRHELTEVYRTSVSSMSMEERRYGPVTVSDELWKILSPKLDDVRLQLGVVFDIALSLNRFFDFASHSKEESLRYRGGRRESPFAQDVKQLDTKLMKIHQARTVSLEDIDTMVKAKQLLDEVFMPDSYVYRTLCHFLVPLRTTLLKEMKSANQHLAMTWPEAWETELQKWQESQEEIVLMEPGDLSAVLWNILVNIRYQREGTSLEGRPDGPPPEIRCSTFEKDYGLTREKLEYVCLEFLSEGKNFRSFQEGGSNLRTLEKHKRIVEEYGGSLVFGMREDGKAGARAELTLIKRAAPNQSKTSTMQ